MDNSRCPSCRSGRVYAGEVIDSERGRPLLALRKEHRRVFYALSIPGASLPKEGWICLECGLVWMQAEPREMLKALEKGNEECPRPQ